jgi:hypothetical protein
MNSRLGVRDEENAEKRFPTRQRAPQRGMGF